MVINMSEYNNVPKIRFKGFTDVWEQRKLGELYNFRYGDGNHNPSNGGKYDVYGANGIIGGYDKFNSEDSIIIGHMGEYAGSVLWAEGKHFVTYNGTITRPKRNNIDDKFGYYMLYRKELNKICGGSGLPFLSYQELNKVEVNYSKNKDEQIKISKLLTDLDNLITLHQRKCDTLVNVKKSLLEKMFPKNSSNIPEIRFKGFTDVWEQRKFENIFNYERPDKYIVNSTEYLEFGPTPVLTANKAFILGYTVEKNKYVNSHESIIFDDFTLDTKFVDFPYMVKSSAIKILTLKDEKKDNIRFNFELLSNHRFNMLGHARHYISVVRPEEVFTTNKQEQNKIGDLFTNLDNLITLHQRKLEKLNNIKKSMLDKMFV